MQHCLNNPMLAKYSLAIFVLLLPEYIFSAELAKRSLAANSQSADSFMVQSYIDQTQFDIPVALANSQKAAEQAPKSTPIQGRLAEVWLLSGDTWVTHLTATLAVPRLLKNDDIQIKNEIFTARLGITQPRETLSE